MAHRIDITFDILTEASVAAGDAAERGFIEPQFDAQQSERPEQSWRLRAAVEYLFQNSVVAETCWAPANNGLGMSVYGNGPHEAGGDPLETDLALHVKGMSLGSMMRLARVLASNGVRFANNLPQLRRAG